MDLSKNFCDKLGFRQAKADLDDKRQRHLTVVNVS